MQSQVTDSFAVPVANAYGELMKHVKSNVLKDCRFLVMATHVYSDSKAFKICINCNDTK